MVMDTGKEKWSLLKQKNGERHTKIKDKRYKSDEQVEGETHKISKKTHKTSKKSDTLDIKEGDTRHQRRRHTRHQRRVTYKTSKKETHKTSNKSDIQENSGRKTWKITRRDRD